MNDNRIETNEEITIAENSLLTISPKETADIIIKILDSKKARDIKLLHIENQTVLADYFVICTGTSTTQIKALADEVIDKLEAGGLSALHVEGINAANWIIIDYASVIVHVFNREMRDFYKLEKLWQDASEADISSLLSDERDI